MRYALVLIVPFLSPSLAKADEPAALGKMLYDDNCMACHTEDASGDGGDGVDIRGLSLARVQRAVKGFDDMPEFEFSSEEIEAITAYLKALDAEI